MRTVLFAAASALCLVFAAARGAEPAAPRGADSQYATQLSQPQLSQPLPPVAPAGTNCIDSGATLSHVAYNTTDDDADCCSTSQYCSQYLSTQMLVQAPIQGHT
jgi:hypothetical protein